LQEEEQRVPRVRVATSLAAASLNGLFELLQALLAALRSDGMGEYPGHPEWSSHNLN
jgi:hypothetical protein